MTLLLVLSAVLLFLFSFVLLFGAPYVPTLGPQVKTALKLADLKPGQVMLELGCGDGKVLIAAAKAGYRVVGYELNPLLAFIAWARTRRYKDNVTVVCGSFWTKPWPMDATAIFVFLHPRFMRRLDKKIVQLNFKYVKLVSFAFEIPGKRATKQENGIFLYEYGQKPTKH